MLTEKKREKLEKRLNKTRGQKRKKSCWKWKGSICPLGFAKMHFNKNTTSAHRVAWILEYGEIPRGHYVLHTCKNKSCTNPAHLYLSKDKVPNRPASKSKRVGRDRLNLDLPSSLVADIKTMAEKYNQTVTKYVGKRLNEIILYEKSLEKSSG